ncbi:MAG: hypothetical protein ABSC04_10825 [Syntrophobacteraceae bacterium]|jgi:hypothetical protein
MKKQRDKSVTREPIQNLLLEHKGRRFVLDCGHRAILGDGRSNTIIVYAGGKAVCHQCGY